MPAGQWPRDAGTHTIMPHWRSHAYAKMLGGKGILARFGQGFRRGKVEVWAEGLQKRQQISPYKKPHFLDTCASNTVSIPARVAKANTPLVRAGCSGLGMVCAVHLVRVLAFTSRVTPTGLAVQEFDDVRAAATVGRNAHPVLFGQYPEGRDRQVVDFALREMLLRALHSLDHGHYLVCQ